MQIWMDRISAVSLAVTGVILIAGAGNVNARGRSVSDLTSMDRHFIRTVGEDNMAEVKIGELAVKRGGEHSKMMGKMMIEDHSKANAQLKNVAAQHDMTLPRGLNAEHRALYNKLSRLRGASFDKAYFSGMVKDHAKAVALFKQESVNVKDKPLSDFVMENLPNIQRHYEHFYNMQSNHMAKM
jgi:putative membrane protein